VKTFLKALPETELYVFRGTLNHISGKVSENGNTPNTTVGVREIHESVQFLIADAGSSVQFGQGGSNMTGTICV
jgi:type IV secretory pathway VirB6-like protein